LSRLHLWRPGNLRAWLFTIMHNLNANARRRAARAPATIAIEVAEFAAPVPPSQEDALNLAALGRALAALPEEQRAVVLLVGLEGFAYAEAAKILGIPVGTVMSRLHRGREQLRRLLAGGTGPSLRRVK
jgi:RNA polymerase sigma-70 factor (ECF subfamily)